MLIKEFGAFHPFGAGNPEPTCRCHGFGMMESRTVGESISS